MKEVCQMIGIKKAKVRQTEGEQGIKEIYGSPEIKGVRGTDRRKYLIDLMRLNPRDANFPDKIKHSQCMIRPEAIRIFNM
jgi:type III secretory pathway component EscU